MGAAMGVRINILRAVLPALVFGSAGLAPVARAADNSCVVLTDAAGDTFLTEGSAASDPALDILRAVFRSDGAALHVRLNVSAGGKPGTRAWSVRFDDGERYYSVGALEEVDGDGFFAYGPGDRTREPSRGRIEGNIDLAAGVVDMTVPLKQLDLSPTARFYAFLAEASTSVGNSGNGLPVAAWNSVTPVASDSAKGTASYRLTRGCPRDW
jgi:hypothetical protein